MGKLIRVLMMGLSLGWVASSSYGADDPMSCVKQLVPKLGELAKGQPPLWIEGFAGTACKGGSDPGVALECMKRLIGPKGVLPGDVLNAASACSGGSTGAGAEECIKSFSHESQLGDHRLTIASVACGGANKGAQALACVKGVAGAEPVSKLAHQYDVAASACRGGGIAEKVSRCLKDLAPVIATQVRNDITTRAAKSDDPNAELYKTRDLAEYTDPARISSMAGEGCSGGNTAEQAKDCIVALNAALLKDDDMPMVVVPTVCSFGQTAAAALDCSNTVIKTVQQAAAKATSFSLMGSINPLIYVERHCTGNMVARVTQINQECNSDKGVKECAPK